MFKCNGSDKLVFNKAELANQMLRIFVLIIAGIVFYFTAIDEVKSEIAVVRTDVAVIQSENEVWKGIAQSTAKSVSDLTRIVDRHIGGHKP